MSLRRYNIPIPAAKYGATDYGQYGVSALTGIIAAGIANDAELFQFRWAPAVTTKIARVRRISVAAAVSTTYFAAGIPLELHLSKCTGWSVAGSGGTAVDPGAANKRGPSTMKATEVAANDMRIATTAGLTAGTKTIATPTLRSIISGAPITSSLSGQIFAADTWLFNADQGAGEHPMELANQEGLIITTRAPGTGTWKLAVQVEWDEAPSFPYGNNR